jgi:hypothetical protein
MDHFLHYNFLVLSLLFLIPTILVYLLRKDLRIVILRMSVCSIPFAFTETLFYPQYWEPVFLFDLINIIGFGIEDVLFVIGLAGFSSTSYAFFVQKKYTNRTRRSNWLIKLIILLTSTFIAIFIFVALKIEMIYASVIIMILLSLLIVFKRIDLFLPALFGGLITLIIYTTLSAIYIQIIPDVFSIVWKVENFSNIFVFSIPLEELMYGFAAGMIATAFYPFVFNLKYAKKT